MVKGSRWLVLSLSFGLICGLLGYSGVLFGAENAPKPSPAPAPASVPASASAPAADEQAQETARLQQKAQVCAACHGLNGVSPNPIWPSLAGQSVEYLTMELKDFRDGKRVDPLMTPQAQTLTDGDIEDLANYYASQKLPEGQVKKDLLALGEKLYRGGDPARGVPACQACHSPDGKGNALARFPVLSGQHPEYTAEELKRFRSGARKNDRNGIMQDIAKRMTDDEILAVASYVSGLH